MSKKLAFVFPGQGSQKVGMLAELAAAHPVIEHTYAEASDALGYDLWQLTQQGPETQLNQTEMTQPALLAGGVAVWRLWQRLQGPTPALLAGHSLGEYTALVAAGALQYADAVTLVADRGRFMQQAVPAGIGAMAAVIGLSDAEVATLCTEQAQGEVLSPANFNSIGQVVVAGHCAAVERLVAVAKQHGARKAQLLPVSVPSHCALMVEAAKLLAERLTDVAIATPQIPVIHNVDVARHDHPDDIRAALVQQLSKPVRWVETIQRFASESVHIVIESGPGKVLAGINKRIIRELPTISLNNDESLQSALTAESSPV